MFDRYRSLTQMQQIWLAVAAAGAFSVMFLLLWYFALRTSYVSLFTGMRTSDAATIVEELDRKHIPYELADGGATILVPADQADATRLNVMGSDLPLKGTVGFELFNKSDMGLTDFAQKINYQRALQGELERTIMTLDGVDSARVHLSLGEDRIFRDDRVPPKASVTVRMRNGASVSQDVAQGVARLVAAAVPQLDPDSVVVLSENGDVVASQNSPAAARAMTPAMEEKRAVEEYYEAKIREGLTAALGSDAVEVAVQADIVISDTGDVLATDGTPVQSGTASRAFGLTVSLSPKAPLDDKWQDTARAVVAQAIGSWPGDKIVFGPITEIEPVADPIAPAAKASAPHSKTYAAVNPPAIAPEPDWLMDAAMALAPLMLLFGAFFLLRRSRGPKRLNARERADFASRLTTALSQDDDRAPQQL